MLPQLGTTKLTKSAPLSSCKQIPLVSRPEQGFGQSRRVSLLSWRTGAERNHSGFSKTCEFQDFVMDRVMNCIQLNYELIPAIPSSRREARRQRLGNPFSGEVLSFARFNSLENHHQIIMHLIISRHKASYRRIDRMAIPYIAALQRD